MDANGLTIVSITDLMREAGIAHDQAFQNAIGEDPEWPIWFANYLQKPINGWFDIDFTLCQLIHCLMDAEFERIATNPDAYWPRYYAEHFVERCAATETPGMDKLALYLGKKFI